MLRRPIPCALMAALLAALAAPAAADSRGPVRVIDADTFDVGAARVRLFGVDAPEADQICLDAQGAPWSCGAWATEEARRRWEGRLATCETLETDRYGRAVSRCEVGGEDVGAALVAGGMALAYRDYSLDYLPQEVAARIARQGLWQGEFQRPQDHRRDPDSGISDVVVLSAPEDCAIKGNVSGSGRIYHLPGSRSYEATRIDESAGERWFCTEEEARAAGWRPPRD